MKQNEVIIKTIKKSKIFSALPKKELAKISSLFEKLYFRKHEYIFMEGDPSDWLYLVSEKRVKMVKHSYEGKDTIVEVKSPGEIFCCSAVLDRRPYPESAQAMEDATAIRISRKNLLRIMDEHPFIKIGIAKYFSDRLRDANEMLKNIATEKVEKRIAAVLFKLSEKALVEDSGYKKIDFSLTRQEIAEMVGTTVETCIRIISRFQKQGMVKSSGKRILVKADSLKEFLEH